MNVAIHTRILFHVNRAGLWECWIWKGSTIRSRHGLRYGHFNVRGTMKLSHRVAYEIVNGPIPLGLVLDHLCKNTLCINPLHLEAVSRIENHRRAYRGC